MKTMGTVVGINGNMVSVKTDGKVVMNEVGYIIVGDKRLKSEVIRIRGDLAQLQVFEITKGVGIGDPVEFTGALLVVELGPGLLGQVYDGLQNPLPQLAEQAGFFLERGIYLDALDRSQVWKFTPEVSVGTKVGAGDILGTVPEGPFQHRIMVPFTLKDEYVITEIKPEGKYKITDTVAIGQDTKGNSVPFTMVFEWPVKKAISLYEERLKPVEPMVTKIRLMDTFFPVAKGGNLLHSRPLRCRKNSSPADNQQTCGG